MVSGYKRRYNRFGPIMLQETNNELTATMMILELLSSVWEHTRLGYFKVRVIH